MNLFEARKSGKRYKLPSWIEYLTPVKHFKDMGITLNELDSDDYILEPDPEPVKKKVTVYRPISKVKGGAYMLRDLWYSDKNDFNNFISYMTGEKIVGWEEKIIEVTI